MKQFTPEHIYLEESVADTAFSRRVVARLPGVPVTRVRTLDPLDAPEALRPATLTQGKRVLLIRQQRGKFLKTCPGCRETVHCNFLVLHQAENCHLECTYCFLQGYLNQYTMTLFGNTDDLFREMHEFLSARPDERFRLGTGEYADSLALDHLTDQSQDMVAFFRDHPNGVLEMKTKSVNIANLLACESADNVVVAWSVNPPGIIAREELKCPGLEERLAAARQVQDHGYPVAFHFDPMFYYEGWEAEYRAVVDAIFDHCDGDTVRWISLGSFRYPPSLKSAIAARFPKTDIIYGEHIPGADGKYRYLKPIRVELYSRMVEWIRARSARPWVYLCMEPREVWDTVFGSGPVCDRDLEFCFTPGLERPGDGWPGDGLPGAAVPPTAAAGQSA